MLKTFRKTFSEFPRRFWVVAAARFVDGVGGTLIFPFFALYITQKFNVGMTQAGMLLGTFSFFGLLGSMLGGGLTDRFGRRTIVLFGLVVSALSALSMGFVEQLSLFYLLAAVVGLLSDIAGPAWQAMVADILPEKQRSEGFGILRVVGNLAWIIGPSIGGLMASRSYLLLFILDAIASVITAAIIYRLIPETMPEKSAAEKQESMLDTFAGYRKVLVDRSFMAYVLVSMIMLLVYLQMYSTLSVYLRDSHGVSTQGYGFLLTSSAITVILLQFWVTRKTKHLPPMLLMAFGSALYMVGFGMFGFVGAYALFVTAIVLITCGEMIVMPVSQALAANFAPEDMRGRYMAIFGLAWAIPSTIGPTLAGMILDNSNPDYLWYIAGILGLLAALGFLWLHRLTLQRFASQPAPEPAGD